MTSTCHCKQFVTRTVTPTRKCRRFSSRASTVSSEGQPAHRVPDNTQRCANLVLTILHLFGIERHGIGESTVPLEIRASSPACGSC